MHQVNNSSEYRDLHFPSSGFPSSMVLYVCRIDTRRYARVLYMYVTCEGPTKFSFIEAVYKQLNELKDVMNNRLAV